MCIIFIAFGLLCTNAKTAQSRQKERVHRMEPKQVLLDTLIGIHTHDAALLPLRSQALLESAFQDIRQVGVRGSNPRIFLSKAQPSLYKKRRALYTK
jgi:hypothetical protein